MRCNILLLINFLLMDNILRIYESMQKFGVKDTELEDFSEGYQFYLERRRMEWIPLEHPCRLVYRTKSAISMVIMPFLIPMFANKIWGIEVCGVIFSCSHKEAKSRNDGDVSAYLDILSQKEFGEDWVKRRFELPIYNNFLLFKRYEAAVEDTATLLAYHNVHFKDFGNSRYWISDKNCEFPLLTKFDGERFLPPFKDKHGKLRFVLHANPNLDCFCAINNKFATPKTEALENCLRMLCEK